MLPFMQPLCNTSQVASTTHLHKLADGVAGRGPAPLSQPVLLHRHGLLALTPAAATFAAAALEQQRHGRPLSSHVLDVATLQLNGLTVPSQVKRMQRLLLPVRADWVACRERLFGSGRRRPPTRRPAGHFLCMHGGRRR